nr:MAG TPA: hypothetical protein [Caudoviricetes sp.]
MNSVKPTNSVILESPIYKSAIQFIKNIALSEERDILVDNQFLMDYREYNTRVDITIYNGVESAKDFSTKAANFDHFDRESFERLLNTSLLKAFCITKDFKIYVGPHSRNNFELRNAPIPVTINDLLDLIDQKIYRSSDLNLFVYKNGEIHITV